MVLGTVIVVFLDPVLSQQIANARDRALIQRQRVKTAVMAERASHEARKIVHNIRLGAQRQMAIEARKYYKSPEVQGAIEETAVVALQEIMRQSGIAVPLPTATPNEPKPDLPLDVATKKQSPDFLASQPHEEA